MRLWNGCEPGLCARELKKCCNDRSEYNTTCDQNTSGVSTTHTACTCFVMMMMPTLLRHFNENQCMRRCVRVLELRIRKRHVDRKSYRSMPSLRYVKSYALWSHSFLYVNAGQNPPPGLGASREWHWLEFPLSLFAIIPRRT